jgi:uncharacterized membrane protein YhaH (DUF805 family)
VANGIPSGQRSGLAWLLFSMRGRISRAVYWPSYLGLLSLNFALYFQLLRLVNAEGEPPGALLLGSLVSGLAIVYANLAIAVKRLHDIGFAGFMAVAVLIPFVNIVFAVWAGIAPGAAGPNRYGAIADRPPP